jgi:hypothetical protein
VEVQVILVKWTISKTLSQNVSWSEKNPRKTKNSWFPAEIQSGHLPSTSKNLQCLSQIAFTSVKCSTSWLKQSSDNYCSNVTWPQVRWMPMTADGTVVLGASCPCCWGTLVATCRNGFECSRLLACRAGSGCVCESRVKHGMSLIAINHSNHIHQLTRSRASVIDWPLMMKQFKLQSSIQTNIPTTHTHSLNIPVSYIQNGRKVS